MTNGKLVIASDRPIVQPAGDRVLQSCMALVQRSGLPMARQEYKLFVTNDSWRHNLFFAGAPQAGGVVYYIFSRHGFLSGADFNSGQLLKNGIAIRPPRSLAYYCAHELTHVLTGDHVGRLANLQIPDWVKEGLADYVAIEPRVPFAELDRILGDKPIDLAMMQEYGVYPRHRLLVTYFLDQRRWTMEELLATRLSQDEVIRMMRAGL